MKSNLLKPKQSFEIQITNMMSIVITIVFIVWIFFIYTWKKVMQHPNFFSLDKIVRRKCSIIGRNLLKIQPECFILNHWHIERHTSHSKLEIKCCSIHKLKMCNFWEKTKFHLKTIDPAIENSTI